MFMSYNELYRSSLLLIGYWSLVLKTILILISIDYKSIKINSKRYNNIGLLISEICQLHSRRNAYNKA